MKAAQQLLKLCLKMFEGKLEKRRRPVQSQPRIHLVRFFSLQCSSCIRPFLCHRPSIKLAVLTKTREDMFQYIQAHNRFSFFLDALASLDSKLSVGQ